jgi:hypothetical protein
MKGVELYGQVRRAVYVEGMSRREAARRFGIDPRRVAKMLDRGICGLDGDAVIDLKHRGQCSWLNTSISKKQPG